MEAVIEKIQRLRRERNAVILAHNYQVGPIQDIADFTGDSLGLTLAAQKTDAKIIVFCGVHFMAETASILCPEKIVLVPDLSAGCGLADMVTAPALKQWKAAHPGAAVVCYINTTAAVKAECDYCVTSSNAEKVIRAIPADREILFAPDKYLGAWVMKKTGRTMHLWPGYCPTHVRIDPEYIIRYKTAHPETEYLVHPECGCLTGTMHLADAVLSTDGMVRRARESAAREFLIATEVGMLHRLEKENPEKRFHPAGPNARCEHMAVNDMEGVLASLEDLRYEVKVPTELAIRARVCIDRMLEITRTPEPVPAGV
ncbi:MAG: quinolinate synthase NadA [Planctomycetota bacterium]